MNLLTQLIAEMIRRWPTLYENRGQALNTIYGAIGSFQWIKTSEGSVIAWSYKDTSSDRAFEDLDEAIAEATKHSNEWIAKIKNGDPETAEHRLEWWEEERQNEIARATVRVRWHNMRMQFCQENAEHLARHYVQEGDVIGSCIHLYGCIQNIPDDAHPDFVDGAVEFITQIVFSTPPKLGSWPYTEEAYKRNVTRASEILGDLKRRFNLKGVGSYEEWLNRQKRFGESLLMLVDEADNPDTDAVIEKVIAHALAEDEE